MSAHELQPEIYETWRNTALGALTERVEAELVFRLAGPFANGRVLDAGCGDGTYAIRAAGRGGTVYGTDLSLPMLMTARHRAAASGVRVCLAQGSLEALPYSDCSFDLVLAVTVLCLVPDAKQAMREMARVLRPGGVLVIGELGRYSVWSFVRRSRAWLGSPVWKAARSFTPGELRALATGAGLSVTRVRGAVYYPLSGTLGRVLSPIDSWLGRLTAFGAAFIALSAAPVENP